MRMLTPRELFRAQGFPESYIIDRKPDGSPISKDRSGLEVRQQRLPADGGSPGARQLCAARDRARDRRNGWRPPNES
jgi:hypothetical protein